MSVSNIEPLIRYKGDGAQTVFPIPYRFLEPEHIRVEIGRSGVTLLLAYLADYTVNESNVVTKVPPAAGDIVAISRETPQERAGDYDETGSVPGSSLNDNYDRAILMIQELASKLKRAVLMPPTGESDATIQDLMDMLSEMLKQVTDWVTEAEEAMKILAGIDFDSLARLDSPRFTGTPTAPTAGKGTSTDQIATTKFVQNEVADFLSPNQSSFVASQWILDQASSKYYHRIVTDARDISHVYKNESGGFMVFDDTVEIHVVDEGYVKLVAATGFDGHIVTLSKRLPVVYSYTPVTNESGQIVSLTLTGIASNPGNITDLDIPSSAEYEGTTYPVKKIGESAFSGSRVTSVNIGAGIETIGHSAFNATRQLQKVVFPETLLDIQDAAFYDSGVPEFNLPNSLRHIGLSALSSINVASIHIPAGVDDIPGRISVASSKLTEITVDPANTHYKSIDGVLYTANMELLLQYPRGKDAVSFTFPAGVKHLAAGAFFSAHNLTSITFSDSLQFIGGEALMYCDAVTDIHITKNVQQIELRAFAGMDDLAAFTVDPDNQNFTVQDGVLYSKDKKELVQYPNAKSGSVFTVINGVETIVGGAFFNNLGLSQLTFPVSLVKLGEGACSGMQQITTFHLPQAVGTILAQGLARCPKLTSITVDEANQAFTAQDGVLYTKDMKELIQYPIGKADSAFTVPDGVERIRSNSFYTSKLTSISFPEGLRVIESQAFQDVVNLTSASFPASLTTIVNACFYHCSSLEEITFRNPGKWTMNNPFPNCPKLFTVWGYPGSTAEDYAKRFNYLFKSLEEA